MAKRKEQKKISMDPKLSVGIVSIFILIIAVIITLSFFGKAGSAGVMMNEWILGFIFGGAKFLTHILLLGSVWMLLKNPEQPQKTLYYAGTALFVLSLT